MLTSMPISLFRSVSSTLICRFIIFQSETDEYETKVMALPLAPARAVLPMRWK